MQFDSKLPDVGTTIFTVMSRRALEEGALNIGQGFPDYPIDPRLAAALVDVIGEGRNQYAPMEGVVELREQICRETADAATAAASTRIAEVTVTCGATEALYNAIQAVVGPGDEAIIFDPAYDAYEPAVRLAGGRCMRVALAPPDFRFDWDRGAPALSARTRLIIINSPQNPSCTVAGARRFGRAGRIDPRPPDHRARPTKCTSTCCTMAGAMPRCWPIRNCGSAVSRCFPSARLCMRPDGGWATAWRRRR